MSEYTSPEHHPAFEEYCETIFELNEDGQRVIQARIAERLEVSRPAVSEMVRRLVDEGLVYVESHEIKLTDNGKVLATTMVRRHRLAERFLTDMLGLSWAQAHHEAGKWEHVISPAVEEAIVRQLDDPTTCPHGNPIPGSGYVEPDLVALSTLGTGATAVITRIPEELEFTPGLLEFLEINAIVPGATAQVMATSPDGTTTIDVDGSIVGVSAFTAERILVAEVQPAAA
ncbi:MAG: metal-dependent transcriptional regulator [Acidimicrobiia bacterium]|nr:metal-dependent transcriptional regulator [Acidimicrobiia bacterium]